LEAAEETKKDKKGKKKKEKENAKETTKIKEEISTFDNSYIEGKENVETDGQAKDEKKKKKNKNKNNNQSVTKDIMHDELMEEKLSKIKLDDEDQSDPKQIVLNYLITVNKLFRR